MVVIEGLKGKSVADLCIEHQIGHAQYYRWRDQFLSNMSQVFTNESRKEKKLTKENTKLKAIRTPVRSKPKPYRPHQWWGIDMTKVRCRVRLDVYYRCPRLVYKEDRRILCRYAMQKPSLVGGAGHGSKQAIS